MSGICREAFAEPVPFITLVAFVPLETIARREPRSQRARGHGDRRDDESGGDPEREVVAAGKRRAQALPVRGQGSGPARGYGRQYGEAERAANLGGGVDQPGG
jgi:hypothetical protein